jgi:hypothetical protein
VRQLLLVGLVGAAATAAILDLTVGPGDATGDGTVDGPVIVHGPWNAYPAAEVSGPLQLQDGCLMIDGNLLVWDTGATWDEEAQAVFLDDQTYVVGDEVQGRRGLLLGARPARPVRRPGGRRPRPLPRRHRSYHRGLLPQRLTARRFPRDAPGHALPMHLDPAAVRRGWQHAENAADEIADALGRISDAAGTSMGDLAACLSDAASDMRGVLDVVSAVITEHGTNVEACIADFQATDGQSAGEFHGLAR